MTAALALLLAVVALLAAPAVVVGAWVVYAAAQHAGQWRGR